MAWSEPLGNNKYKLVERDPSKASRPKRSMVVEMPAKIAQSKSEKKKEDWLAVQEDKWSELVISGQTGPSKRKKERVTFSDFVPVWKKGYADQNMGEYTRKIVIANIDIHLIPKFGDTYLDQITTLELVTLFAELARKDGKPMATNTKLNVYKATKSIFDAAYDWKLIKLNPIEGVKRPSQSKKEKKEIRSRKKNYTRSEVETLLIALYALPTRWRLYFTGCMMGGFRRGEMLAVEWPDLDYERGAIWIEKQITLNEEGKKVEGEVKTEESEGWIAMPRWYMDDLKAYRREWAKEKLNAKEWRGEEKKEYIFHGGDGQMYYPSTPTSTWRKFLRKNGLPHVKLHGLRHTAGMLLRESKFDLKTIQERLRHTKIGTTADIYTHESEVISREAADHLESLDPKNLSTKFAP